MPTLCQHPKFGEFFEFCAALIIPLKGFSQRKLQEIFSSSTLQRPAFARDIYKMRFLQSMRLSVSGAGLDASGTLETSTRSAPPDRLLCRRAPTRREIEGGRSHKQALSENDPPLQGPRRPVRIVEGSQPLDRFGASTAVRHRRQRFSSLTRRINALLFHWLTTQTAGNRQCIH